MICWASLIRGSPMGLRFHSSISSGPFRLNFSKSGVGVSVGVRGLRVGAGPRGTYVRTGRNSGASLLGLLFLGVVGAISQLVPSSEKPRETTVQRTAVERAHQSKPTAQPVAVGRKKDELATGSVPKPETKVTPSVRTTPQASPQEKHARWIATCNSRCVKRQDASSKSREPFDWNQCVLSCLTEVAR
jgi:hypothetical protein